MENNNVLFSCHNAHGLLTEPKSKADKDAGLLSETAKTLVKDLWLKNTYGYRERIMTDEMYKGLICEQDSIGLVSEVLGNTSFRRKYVGKIQNDYIIGTPDVLVESEDCIEDVKTSYNLRTFMNAELTPTYYTQGQCYMWLTGKKHYRLIYCLVPTPSEIIQGELIRMSYKYYNIDKSIPNIENKDYIEACEQLEHNNSLILTLPKEQRVKVFEFDYNEDHIDKLRLQIDKARIFYNSLKL